MGSWEPMIPIEEKIELRWTRMKVYFPLAKAKKLIPVQNIRAILEAAGSSLRDVVRVGVFLADLKDFDAMNAVYGEFFPQDAPARTTVGAQLPRIKVEIDCIARVSKL